MSTTNTTQATVQSTPESPTSSPSTSTFTTHASLTPFQVPSKTYLSISTDTSSASPLIPTPTLAQDPRPTAIATGALTFDLHHRILLLQRASTDSMPNLWETPGGACDDADETILHGVARELAEETGLVARRIGPRVGGGYVFRTSRGLVVEKVNFLVEVEGNGDGESSAGSGEGGEHGWMNVRLDPKEHQRYVWAGEEEVREGRMEAGGVVGDIEFTTVDQRQVILDAFQVRRKLMDDLDGKAGGT